MERTAVGLAVAGAIWLLGTAVQAHSQTSPAAASAADLALASQKAAFLALPESTRKAAQDALIWLGFYNGVADGDFGKRTRDAIVAFQSSAKTAPDGALTPVELQTLLAAAQKARDAVGFKTISDPKTGASIGAPVKLIGPRSASKLDFLSSANPGFDALYARLTVATPTRKIAYKAIKPDAFFVVSGQEGAANFYTRFEKNAAASPPIRGFIFSYPTAEAARLDRVALAVANSFQAFPEPAKSQPTGAVAATAPGTGSSPSASTPVPTATALIVAPGKALTALKADDCANPTAGGKPVRIERVDSATKLALIVADFDSNGQAPRFGAPDADVLVLGYAGARLAASPATFAGGDGRPAVVAAIETSAGGGPVFDRRGALVGLVAPIAEEPRRVAGVALAATHAVIGPDAVRAFLGAGESAPENAAPLSAGDIAAREERALLAVYCEK